MSRAELLSSSDVAVAARPIDCSAIAAADPDAIVMALVSKIDSIEFGALELSDLADKAPPSHAVRARALAEAANREAAVLRRRADGLRHQLQMRSAVERVIEDGEAVADLLDGVRHLIETHDLRQAGVVERRGRPRRQPAAEVRAQ